MSTKMALPAACVSLCDKILDILDDCVENPEAFGQTQLEKSENFVGVTKSLYRLEVRVENKNKINPTGLPKLLTNGFDEEGIWQQIHLQNIAALKYFEVELGSMAAAISQDHQNITCIAEEAELSSESPEASEKDYSFDDDESDVESEYSQSKTKVKITPSIKSEVDDKFFNLHQMEQFLYAEDLKEAKKSNPADSSDSESIDMFEDIPSDEADSANVKANSLMYSDFFDPPSCKEGREVSEDEGLSDMENDGNLSHDEGDSKSRQTKLLLESDEEEDHGENAKTSFQKLREADKKKIEQMEESLLKPKPWQLTGEVAAGSRPKDSLVHQPTTFDCNAKQDSVSTDELTERIEQIVKSAILNKAWNDVERKVKPKADERVYHTPVELDQNKSKKGLAEVYEDEYLKLHNKPEAEEAIDPKHMEIKKLMDELVPQLNALFAFIPKPPVPEITVVNNMPAVTLEEVAPVALSEAALLAPEEVKKKTKGDVIAKCERSATDKKRERRKKKSSQKHRQRKLDEKLQEQAATSSLMASKYEKIACLKKLKQSKNTQIVNNDSRSVKSSKEFFSRLQDKSTTEAVSIPRKRRKIK